MSPLKSSHPNGLCWIGNWRVQEEAPKAWVAQVPPPAEGGLLLPSSSLSLLPLSPFPGLYTPPSHYKEGSTQRCYFQLFVPLASLLGSLGQQASLTPCSPPRRMHQRPKAGVPSLSLSLY